MSQTIRQSELLDRLIADIRNRWQSGDKVLVESYVERHPDIRSDDGLLGRLVLLEFQLRREFGDHPDPANDVQRFPQLADQVSDLLQLTALKCGIPRNFPQKYRGGLPIEAYCGGGAIRATRDWVNLHGESAGV
jgi:hypothetical protein